MNNEKSPGEILDAELTKVEAVIDAAAAVVAAAHEKYPDSVGKAVPRAGGFAFMLNGHEHRLNVYMQQYSQFPEYALTCAGGRVATAYFFGDSPAALVGRVIAVAVAECGARNPAEAESPAVSEEELVGFMRQRIEDGELDAEDIPARLVRYGLMDPSQFKDEMVERMEMRAQEAAE